MLARAPELTVGGCLALATARLGAAGCETPRLDAEVLLGSVLDVDRARLVIDRRDRVSAEALDAFEALLVRREAREPVAYLIGYREFRRLRIGVDRRVLIPRPETELLVEVGLGLGAGASVVDVGTGSGAIALALADERPDLDVRGLDVSDDALAIARANASSLGLPVSFGRADLLDDGVYDAVLANLPYVPDGAELAPEIARYEPAGALFAGSDGLDCVRRLCELVAARSAGSSPPSPPGAPSLLALEISPEQAVVAEGLVRRAGFASVQTLPDLAGLARVVVGRRNA